MQRKWFRDGGSNPVAIDQLRQSSVCATTTTGDFRIAVIGNQGSYGYRICNWLRRMENDAELFLLEGADRQERDLPENVDRALEGGYPSWIHQVGRFSSELSEVARRFDVGLTVGPSGLKAITRLSDLPVVHFAMGSELYSMPTSYTPPDSRFLQWLDKVKYRFLKSEKERGARAVALHARKSYRQARRIIALSQEAVQAAWQIGEGSKLCIWPFPEDVEGNRRRIDPALLQQLTEKYRQYDRVFLWLSRINYRDKEAAHYKGTDHFLDAYEALVAEYPGRVHAVVGDHGFDGEAFQADVDRRGIANSIDFVSHLPFWKLITYLSIPNAVVCDQIVKRDCVTGLVRECLSIGTPAMQCVDQALMRICFLSALPVVSAEDRDTCLAAMKYFVDMSAEDFTEKCKTISTWSANHLDFRVIIPRLVLLLREVCYLEQCGKHI